MDVLADIFAKVGFDWRLAVASVINFLLVYWVVRHFFFDPIVNVLDTRERMAREGILQAERTQEEYAKAAAQRAEVLIEARKEAEQIVHEAHSQAERMADRARAKVLELRDEALKAAQHDIERERTEMEQEIYAHAGELVSRGVERVLNEELDADGRERVARHLVTARR